jgi:CRP/FNR family cyclic AMP-dependent transcriptional regulator
VNETNNGHPGSLKGFWQLLTRPEQDALLTLGRVTVFPPGTTMCVEGDPATHVFVLVAGWVKVLSVTRDGQELLMALRGQGDVVGDVAGEATGYRTATVRAIGLVRSLIVGHDAFTSFLDTNNGADHAYRRVVTQRWNEASVMLLRHSTTSGPQRLAALLLDLAARHGVARNGEVDIELPLSQHELAGLAGVARATLTRAFTGWRRRGLIRTTPRHITIINIDGLRRITRE